MPHLRFWSYLPVTALALALAVPVDAGAQASSSYPSAQQQPAPAPNYPPPQQPAYPPAQNAYPAPQQGAPAQNAYPPPQQQPADPAYPPPSQNGYPAPQQQPSEPSQGAYPAPQQQPAEPSQNTYPAPPQPTYAPPTSAQQVPAEQTPRGSDATATDAPRVPPESGSLVTQPQAPLTPDGRAEPSKSSTATASTTPPPPEDTGVMLDGRPRQGPFLSGPGSLTFMLHHTTLGALGGFFTQAFANDFSFNKSSREAMLAGTLIGAGLGFGASAWWQFNNWVDKPMANFGIGNSVVGGMFMAGFMDLFTQDPGVLTWSAFLGAELGAWLTAGLGGGQLPLADGLLVASGAGWGLAYAALLLAVIHFSGTDVSGKTWRDTLLLAPGIGAGALALATMRYNPTPTQILRADIFGAGVGAAVLLISGLVLGGFDQSTPYVLSFLGSAGAITTVSLLWEESVDRSAVRMVGGPSLKKARPYKNVWW